MSVRYRLRHETRFDYASPVTLSQNLAHLAPRDDARQRVNAHRLTIDPEPVARERRGDWFGNACDRFTVAAPHRRLVVTSEAEVAITASTSLPAEATPAWEDARTAAGEDASVAEHRFDSPLIPCARELRAYAAPSFAARRPALAAALDLVARIHRDFAYDPGATSLATTVVEALELRRGVCQDFAQVLIGCLRSLGLASRYVSGYLETSPPPGAARLVGADASHAWAQLWCGVAAGWIDLDPTNDCIPGDRHIVVAIGRDFADVSPLRGMVLGGGAAEIAVSVDVARVAG